MSDQIRVGDFGSAIMQIAEEKGIAKDRVIEIVEAALAAAYKKEYGKKGQNIRAEFNAVTGDTKFYLIREVVDATTREFREESLEEEGENEKENSYAFSEEASFDGEKLARFHVERDIVLDDAKALKGDDVKLGDVIESELPTLTDFGRVAAQTAKQVIIQRIREAERDSMFLEYKEKEGKIVSGTVQRVEGHTVYIDLGKSIGVLFPSEQVRSEHYAIGRRLKVYVQSVASDPKGPGIVLSRIHPDMVSSLFALEVPEIFAGTVEIKAIAREAGARTKIAVFSKEEGIDPIGSCVGQKGTRVQAITDELGGEKIDIVEWHSDPKKFIRASLSPAKVTNVELNLETKEARVFVPGDQLSLAIGRSGQNVRLAVKLTGFKIDVAPAVVPKISLDTDEDKDDSLTDIKIDENAGEEKITEEKVAKEEKADSAL